MFKLKKKYNIDNMQGTVKSSIAFTFCNFFQKGLSIIAVPIFTRLLRPEEYGVYSLFISWFWLLIIFTSLNMYENSLNNAMIKFKDDREGYISSVFVLSCLITIGLYLIYLPFNNIVEPYFGLNYIYMTLLFLQLLSMPAIYFWTNRNKFDYNYRMVVIVTISMSVLSLLISIVGSLLASEENRLFMRIFLMVIVQVVFCIFIAIYLMNKGKKIIVLKYWKYALSFNLPLIPYYLSVTILNQSDRLMINYFIGESETAYYSLAYSIATLTTLITNGINSSLSPWIYKNIKQSNVKIRDRISQIAISMGAVILLFILVAPEIIRLFASSEYYDAIYVIPSISVGVYYIFISQLLANFLFYYEKKVYVMIASIASAVINIILNYWCIPIFGYIAAGYTTLISYIILCALYYCFYRKMKSENFADCDYVDLKHILFACGIVTMIGLLIQIVYNYTILRVVLLLLVLLYLYIIVIKHKKERQGKKNDIV